MFFQIYLVLWFWLLALALMTALSFLVNLLLTSSRLSAKYFRFRYNSRLDPPSNQQDRAAALAFGDWKFYSCVAKMSGEDERLELLGVIMDMVFQADYQIRALYNLTTADNNNTEQMEMQDRRINTRTNWTPVNHDGARRRHSHQRNLSVSDSGHLEWEEDVQKF